MKQFVCFAIFFVVLAVHAARTKAVVYVDKFIPNEGCTISAGSIQILQDRIVGNVTSSRKYEVVDRENLDKVQKELKLVDAGMTEGNAPESNRLKAAGYCIYGKVLQYRTYKQDLDIQQRLVGIIELQIRIENITTGRILGAKTFKTEHHGTMLTGAATTQNMEQEVMTLALEKAAKEVAVKLNDIAFPVAVLSANDRFVTCNVTEEQVSLGDVWEVFVLGDELKDDMTGESLGFDEELIASVRVSRPNAKTTKFAYGATDATAEKDKKAILDAKAAGEKMLLRKAPDVVKPKGQSQAARTSRLDGIR